MPNNTTCFLLTPSFNTSTQNHSIDVFKESLLALIAIAILSPVAVVGNALVLAAIWRNTSLRTPSYILLAGLAFTDLSTGIITEPLFAANELIHLVDPMINPYDQNNWPTFYLITRNIGYGCLEYFFNLTSLIITFMSIERWLHMSRRSIVTVRRLYLVIAVLLFLPIPLAVLFVNYKGHVKAISIAIMSVLLFCLSVTSVAYFKVFRIIRRHQHQIHANESSQNFYQPTINFEKYKKSVFSILYILVIFYIGYFPMAFFLGVMLFLKKNCKLIHLSFYVSITLAFLSSSLNPLLYLWRMKDIRNEVKKLVKRILFKDN